MYIVSNVVEFRAGDMSKFEMKKVWKVKKDIDAKNNRELIIKLVDFYDKNKGRDIL